MTRGGLATHVPRAGDFSFVLRRGVPVAVASIALATLGSLAWPPEAQLPPDVPDFDPLEALVRWDAGWYGEIAENGYWLRDGQQSPVAFFPLYPMAIAALSETGLNRWISGSVIAFASALAGLAVFRRWARGLARPHAEHAFWLLALYPFAEYLYGVVYSDALFLALTVAAFSALEDDRPWLAMLLGALATACRPVAPAVVLGLVVRAVERRRAAGQRVRAVELLPALAALGLLGYMTYLGVAFGDPLAFAHIQGAPGWDQPPGWESWLKLKALREIASGSVGLPVIARLGAHALVTVLALALVVPTWKRLGAGYGLYCLAVVAIPAVSSKDFQGLGRYVIAAFPLFLTAAMLLAGRPRARVAVYLVSALGLACCAVLLGAGVYVA
jgi:hypothetical protein